MNRIAVALVVLALAGCGGGKPSSRSVLLYWSFQRHVVQPPGTVDYDTQDPGGGDGACAQSGVDFVTVTDEAGNVVNPELPQIPCTFQGAHGVQINAVRRGARTWTVTGYRNDGTALFQGQTSFDVDRDTRVEVVVPGIRDDVDVNYGFVRTTGEGAGACGGGTVQFVGYTIVDGAGTVVAQGEAPCSSSPPRLSFGAASGTALDRDVYTVRFVGYPDANPATKQTYDDQRFPQCQAQTFNHFGPNTGSLGWNVVLRAIDPGLTLCQ